MSDEAITITIKGGIDGKIATSLREIATQALSADSALTLLKQNLTGFKAVSELEKAARSTDTLERELKEARKATLDLTQAMVANSDVAKANTVAVDGLTKRVDALGTSQKRTGDSLGALGGVVTRFGMLVGGALSVGKIIQYTSAWTDMQSRVGLAVKDLSLAPVVMGRINDMARRTYSSLEQTAEGFLRNSTSLRELGYSTEQSLDFVEALNNALVVSGAKGQRAASVMNALSKAMSLGKLNGDNLNTVLESGGRVTELLAETLGVTTNELRALGKNGEITGEVINRALTGNLAKLREEAESMPATIQDAFVLLDNALLALIGRFGEVSGASSAVAEFIIMLADNIGIVVGVVGAFGAAWAAVSLAKLAVEFSILVGVVVQFTAAMVASNLTLVLWVAAGAALLAMVIAIHYAYMRLTGQVESFDEYMGNMMDGIKSITEGVKEWAKETLGLTGETDVLEKAQKSLTATTQQGTSSFEELTKATKASTAANNEWAKQTTNNINSVVSSYNQLLATQREAASAAGAAQFAKNDPGPGNRRTVGSFTTLGKGAGLGANSLSKLPGYANGGSFMVGGRTGIDKNLVSFRATKGERVDVSTPAQQRAQRDQAQNGNGGNGGPVVIINVQTPDADSFRLSRGQIAANMSAALSGF